MVKHNDYETYWPTSSLDYCFGNRSTPRVQSVSKQNKRRRTRHVTTSISACESTRKARRMEFTGAIQ